MSAHVYKPPFQLIVFRHRDDRDGESFEDAILKIFVGGRAEAAYDASGEDLGIEIRRFHRAPESARDAGDLIAGCSHTLVVAILGGAARSDTGFLSAIHTFASKIGSSRAHRAIAVLPDVEREKLDDEEIEKGFLAIGERAGFDESGVTFADEIGESALRPAHYALGVLDTATTLLLRGLPSSRSRTNSSGGRKLKLFISHAKLDGLPLARALRYLIGDSRWLEKFYDADDLKGLKDWETAMEEGVRDSVLVILRTDIYDSRPWCRQEVLWAEEYVTPTVLVEARPGLSYPAGVLPLERMPSVRIPDGNLVRILHAAAREGFRNVHSVYVLENMASISGFPDRSDCEFFPYPPGMSALSRICRSGTTSKYLVYPDPPLREGVRQAAQAYVSSLTDPPKELKTPTEILLRD